MFYIMLSRKCNSKQWYTTTQLLEWAKSRTLIDSIKCWWGCRATGTALHCWECQVIESFSKTVWWFLTKQNICYHARGLQKVSGKWIKIHIYFGASKFWNPCRIIFIKQNVHDFFENPLYNPRTSFLGIYPKELKVYVHIKIAHCYL